MARRSIAAVLLVLSLLCVSCEKKAAPPVFPSRAGYFIRTSEGGGGGGGAADFATDLAPASPSQSVSLDARKIIRTGSLDLLVNDVGKSIEKIGSIVTAAGGFVEKSTQSNSGGHSATMTVRVPAGRLDQVRAEIKSLATSVERESVEVRDVTRDYIDLDARLRNAQAEEAQYLQILKRATTIKDTLDVTEKLSDVRGRIEQLQGEMKFLTAQIDLSSLEIALRAETEEAIAGIHWRPLRQAKVAVAEMVSGLADWADSVIAFFINLPLIAVWLLSILVLVLAAVRLLRFLWRRCGPKTTWRLPWPRSTPHPPQGSG
jgi:hypothetical protein